MALTPIYTNDNTQIQYYKWKAFTMNVCHMHDVVELLFILTSTIQAENTGIIMEVKAPAIIIHNRYTLHRHSSVTENGELYERYLYNITGDQLSWLQCNPFLENSMTVISLTDEMRDIMRFYSERGMVLRDFSEEYLQLVSLIFRELALYCNDENTRTVRLPRSYIGDVMQYIVENVAEPLSLEGISSHFFISRAKLVADFRASTGITVKNYITLVRMNMARSMLTEGISVAECAVECGYNNESNFIVAFKRMHGISPYKYAKEMRNHPGNY